MKNYFKNIPYMQILCLLALVYLGVWGVRGTCNAPFFGEHTRDCTINKVYFPRQDVTSTWQIYRNDQYKFEFSYPPVYTIRIFDKSTVRGSLFTVILDSTTIGPGEGGYGPLSSISIGVWDNSKQLSLIDWAEDEYNRSFSNYNGDGFADFENKTLAEHKAISYSWEGLGYGKTVIIENNKVIFLLDTGGDSKTERVWQDFDDVLSTFKFTK